MHPAGNFCFSIKHDSGGKSFLSVHCHDLSVLHGDRQAGSKPGLVWALAEVDRSENQQTVCVGRDPKVHLVQPSCSEQEHLLLDKVVLSVIQPDFDCF